MRAIVVKNPVEVGNRLEELGLRKDQLLEVVEAMVSARAECTANDPPAAPGWSAWRMGTRRLREVLLVEEDWEKDDSDQISSVVNKIQGVRIVVANTDELTQIDDGEKFPQNRSKKGAATDRVVHSNQGSFMDILDKSMKIVSLAKFKRPKGSIITFYLCVYSDGDTHRAELSCPVSVDAGFFSGFIERIFLDDPTGGGDPDVRRRKDDGPDTGDFDIPVRRK